MIREISALLAGAWLMAHTGAHALPVLHIETPAALRAQYDDDVTHPVLRIGLAVPLTLDAGDGAWTLYDDGSATWALRLQTDDARYIGLLLSDAVLPPGAQVLLEGDDGPGPLAAGVQRDRQNRLWVAAQPGSGAVLRIVVPSAARLSDLRLGRAEVHYGTHDLTQRMSNVGRSGDCHNNTACPQGGGWGTAIRATARIVIGNQWLCTATLVRDTRDSGRPLLLTADHCGIRTSGGFPAESVTALFRFESSECNRDTGIAPCTPVAGLQLLYRDPVSDIALLQLEGLPSNCALSFSGWNAGGGNVTRGASVHHPSGDVKKISLFTAPASRQTVDVSDGALVGGSSRRIESWKVDEWSDGVTEPGSSGAGLWDQNRHLVGVLSGGASRCPRQGFLGIGARPGQDGPDFYGRLDVAWNRPGELGTPLRRFLDPDGGSSGGSGGHALSLLLLSLAAGLRLWRRGARSAA